MKRVLALILSVVMVLGCMSFTVSAADWANAPTLSLSASGPDANDTVTATLHFEGTKKYAIGAYTLNLIYDPTLVTVDESAGSYAVSGYDDDFNPITTTYGIDLPDGLKVGQPEITPKATLTVSGQTKTAYALSAASTTLTVSEVSQDLVIYFKATDEAKSSGSTISFTLATDSTDNFALADNTGNNKMALPAEGSITASITPPVSSATVTGTVTTPAKGGTDATSLSAGDNFNVTWAWDNGLANGGAFAASTAYTLTVTLTPKEGTTLADGFTVTWPEGFTPQTPSGTSYVATKTFAATADKTLVSIQPTKYPDELRDDQTPKQYVDGDTVNLTGLVVEAKYDDNTVDDDFKAYELKYTNGTSLTKGDTTVKLVATENAEIYEFLKFEEVKGKPFTNTAMNLSADYSGQDQLATLTGQITMPDDVDGTVAYLVKQDGTECTEIVAAGSYTVYATLTGDSHYEDVTATAPVKVADVTVNKADWTGSKEAAAEVKYGNSGSVDLSAMIAEGATLGALTVSDASIVLESDPAVESDALSFQFKADAATVGKTATVSIPVTGAKNYKDYALTVTLTVLDKMAQADFGFDAETQSKTYGDAAFTAAASGNVTGTTVSYASSNEDVATVDASGEVTVKAAGEAVITATATGTDDYAEASASYTLTVAQREAALTWSETALTYNGSEQSVTATVSNQVDGDVLTLAYSGNTGSNAGDYTATLTGLGNDNYKLPADASQAWTIAQKTVSASIADIAAVDYTGEAQTPAVVNFGEDNLTEGTDYTVDYSNNTDAGTATVTVSGKEGSNYTFETATKTFTINQVDWTGTKTADAEAKYGNSGRVSLSAMIAEGATIGTPAVSDESAILDGTPNVTDGILNFRLADVAANVNKTATVTVPVTGAKNYKDYDLTVTLKVIDKPSQENFKFAEATQTKTYGDAAFTVAATGNETGSTVSYTSGNEAVATVNAATGEVTIKAVGSAEITAFASATDDYAEASASYTLTVAQREAALVWSAETLTYNGEQQSVTAEVSNKVGEDSFTLSYEGSTGSAAGSYSAKVTALGNDNYKLPADATHGWTIAQKSVTAAIADIAAVTYNGAAQTPAVDVSFGQDQLVKDTDYTVAYSNNTDAGTATVSVSGKEGSNYTFETATKTFTIQPLTAVIEWSASSLTYNGSEQSVTATVSNLVDGDALTLAYSGNTGTNAGDYTATLTGLGNANYALPENASQAWTIAPKTVSASIEDIAAVDYTGAALTPTVNVSFSEDTLVKDTDYTVAYSDNTNAGTATVTVSSVDGSNYGFETVTKTFTINRIDQPLSVADKINVRYNGSVDLSALVSGTAQENAELKYELATGSSIGSIAGSVFNANATENDVDKKVQVNVTADQTTNYNAFSASIEVTITSKETLDAAYISLPDQTVVYNGEAQPMEASLTGAYANLPEWTGANGKFTYSYTAQGAASSADAPVNAGDYTVVATYEDDVYMGTATCTYRIQPLTAQIAWSETALTYNGSEQSVTATVSNQIGEDSFTLAYTGYTGTNAGSYTATLTDLGNANYALPENAAQAWSIAPKSVTATIAAIDPVTYSGEEQTPTLSLSFGEGNTLTEDQDYTIAYSNNINAGTATVTVSSKENSNYSFDAVTANFTIERYDLSGKLVITPAQTSYDYTGEAIEPEVTVTLNGEALASEDYNVRYTANTNAGTASVVVNGLNNYTGKQTASFTIAPKAMAADVVTVEDLVYTGKALTPVLSFKDGTPALKKNVDYTVGYAPTPIVDAGTYTATVTFKGNYSGTATASFAVKPVTVEATVAAVGVDTDSFVYTGSAQAPAVSVIVSGRTLREGTDYSISYTGTTNAETTYENSGKPTEAGEYKAVLSFTGNYADGETKLERAFTIARAERSLSLKQTSLALKVGNTANVSDLGLSDNASGATYTYAAGGAVTVEDGVITAGTEAGSGRLTITAEQTANYEAATLTVPVTVTEKDARSISFATETAMSAEYGATGASNAATISPAVGELSYSSSNPDVATVDPATGTLTIQSVGKTTITASVAADETYAEASNSYELTVTPKDLSSEATVTLTLPEEGYSYDNTAKRPAAEVKLGEETLTAGADYILSYSANVNAGTAKATVTFIGNYSGATTAEFTIAKAERGEITVPATLTLSGDSMSASVKPAQVNDLDGSASKNTKYTTTATYFTVGANGQVTGKANGSGATITVRIAESTNYNAATATVENVIVIAQEIGAVSVTEQGDTGDSKNMTATVDGNKIVLTGIADPTKPITVSLSYFDGSDKTVQATFTIDATGEATFDDAGNGFDGTKFTLVLDQLTVKTPELAEIVIKPTEVQVADDQEYYQDLTEEQAKSLNDDVQVNADDATLSGALASEVASGDDLQNALDNAQEGTEWINKDETAPNYEFVEEWSMRAEVTDYKPVPEQAEDEEQASAKLVLDIAPTSSIVARETMDDGQGNQQTKPGGEETVLETTTHSVVDNPVQMNVGLPKDFPTAGLYIRHWLSAEAYRALINQGVRVRSTMRNGEMSYYEDIIPALQPVGGLFRVVFGSRFFSEFEIRADGREVEAHIFQPDGTELVKTLTTASETSGEKLLVDDYTVDHLRFDGWVISDTTLGSLYGKTVSFTDEALSAENGVLDELIANKDADGKIYLYAKTTEVWHVNLSTTAGAPTSLITNLNAEGYEDGERVELTATSNSSYRFENWTEQDGVTVDGAKLTIDAIHGNVDVTANYSYIGGSGSGGSTTDTNEPEETEKKFVDVQDENAWFYDAVYWAAEKGITTGVDEDHFDPDGTCTRAQMVTFLWRYCGEQEPTLTESPFEDVQNTGAYYYKAVLWAVENGITKGTDETHFSPDNTVTRGQSVTFLYRTAKAVAGENGSNPFVDVKAEDYFYEAVLWAVENGITKGTDETHFSGANDCIRAQIVTFLYRFDQNK